MGARIRKRKGQYIVLNEIYKQPVGLNMTFPKSRPIPFEFMIPMLCRKRVALPQLIDNSIYKRPISSPRFLARL